jgi:hypothetical protein
MRHSLLVKLLWGELVLLVLPLAINDPTGIAAVCLIDVLVMVVLLWVEMHGRRSNAMSPVLWGLLGYIVFGQLSFAINILVLGDKFDPGLSEHSIVITGRLILAGYRAVLLGVVWSVGRGTRWQETRVAMPPLSIIVLIALFGAAARLIYRNQFTDSMHAEFAWYSGFLFVCTPISMCLAVAWRGQNAPRLATKVVATAILLLGLLVGMGDVSRKDTGAAIVPALLGLLFTWRPQNPVVIANARVVGKLIVMGVCGWLILMGTRALSWSITNHTPFMYELQYSLTKRQAQDTTGVMAFVVDTTPRIYPYLNGATLGSLLPIPRVLWPDRPPAHSYFVGLQWRGISSTEFNPHMMGKNQLSLSAHVLGEGYANFGYPGAIGLELLFGILIGLYERRLREGRLRALRILCPTILFFIITQQRGDLAMSNTLWLESGIVLWAILLATRMSGVGVRVSRLAERMPPRLRLAGGMPTARPGI